MSATALPWFKRPALAALCTVAALGLTACGPLAQEAEETGPFAGLSGPEIADKAMKATSAASSLTLDMNLKTTDGPMKAYMAIDTKGQCAGTLTLGSTGTAELIKTGQVAYMRFDEAFLLAQSGGGSAEETAAVLKELKGRWVETDVKDPDAQDSLELCELDKVLSEFRTGIGFARKGEETTVNGRKALTLTESDGGTTTRVFVATEGEPYVLRIELQGGEEPGTMSFSEYNKPVPAKKPAAKDIVDLDEQG
ncbi:hypothetical protein [Streptomyces sp. SP18CS02]|uniref:hypothetical protein n=1 Tax=Streptomyces sp. SP18CS02 TaxID=3002531 RepID=UPI002E783699|nr:hypothetical protein [Streptomyces sp. SP18CS02]MEE1755905.1 hypothetical protein [Streptomyces sp. SP18CS02]